MTYDIVYRAYHKHHGPKVDYRLDFTLEEKLRAVHSALFEQPITLWPVGAVVNFKGASLELQKNGFMLGNYVFKSLPVNIAEVVNALDAEIKRNERTVE